jgi:hypothetical protein
VLGSTGKANSSNSKSSSGRGSQDSVSLPSPRRAVPREITTSWPWNAGIGALDLPSRYGDLVIDGIVTSEAPQASLVPTTPDVPSPTSLGEARGCRSASDQGHESVEGVEVSVGWVVDLSHSHWLSARPSSREGRRCPNHFRATAPDATLCQRAGCHPKMI